MSQARRETVYLNGEFVPYEKALVPIEDRGLLFADGVYEVLRYYGGRPFELDAHLRRLEASAARIRLELPEPAAQIGSRAGELVRRNGLDEAKVYIQVTRGPAPRDHAFPAQPRSTFFMTARAVGARPEAELQRGATAITVPDRRWEMCDIKSIGLLANVLARQQAKEAGAFEALFVRNGVVTEGTGANVFAVVAETLFTHPEGAYILSGITRAVTIERIRRRGWRLELAGLRLEELLGADEVFLTGTTSEVTPLVSVDGRPIGGGRPGPVALALYADFQAIAQAVREGRNPPL